MAVPVATSWQVETAAGEPSAIVRVSNLQSSIQGPHDAWGRQGRPQPLLVSAEVVLEQRFGSSSATDSVETDTVHYGLLSKAILATLGQIQTELSQGSASSSLYSVLDRIWLDLTGFDVKGTPSSGYQAQPFLSISVIRRLSVTVQLPKASLLGSAVGLSASAVFQHQESGPSVQVRGMRLTLEALRVPTLIGVNDNERLAKQVVVANIGIERYQGERDTYTLLEAAVVETMVNSSYETLEALATDLSSNIASHLKSTAEDAAPDGGWQIGIGLEKPTAVALADAVRVELRVNTKDM